MVNRQRKLWAQREQIKKKWKSESEKINNKLLDKKISLEESKREK